MTFEAIRKALPAPVFTLAFLRQLFDIPQQKEKAFAVQLSRWETSGKIYLLRRGLYSLVDSKPNTLALANQLVEPSYISGEYALSHYGLIQDAAFEATSACRISPRRSMISTPYGRYSYRQVKVFDGFSSIVLAGDPVFFASPEKALIDTWHWLRGPWTPARHEGMRYENLEIIRPSLLKSWARAFKSPRLRMAVDLFLELRREELERA